MAKPSPSHKRVFDIFGPAVRRPFKPQVAVVTAGQSHVLDPGIVRLRGSAVIELRLMADPVGDRDRRVEGDRVAGDRRYLLDLVGRPVAVGKPAPGAGRGVRVSGRGKIVVTLRRVVLLPDHPEVGRGPDLPAPLRVGLPGRARSLIQQDNLPHREPGGAGHLHRICPGRRHRPSERSRSRYCSIASARR